MTKKQLGFKNAYENSLNYYGQRTLHDCYNSFSSAKYNAYNYCKQLVNDLNGYDDTIVGFNCMFFSFAFKYMKNGVEHMRYETHCNSYDFEIA